MNNLLWNMETEKKFFLDSLASFAAPKQLFYELDGKYYAYVPKNHKNNGQTLQCRNSLIGHYTENWACRLLEPIAKKLGLYAVNDVVCDEIALSKQSSADIAFCTTKDKFQTAANIKLIFEVKMSIVWNYIFKENKIIEIGDYKTHQGNPSLLRSDSMLKAIGKAVNIRVSGEKSKTIPIVILGNSPITKNYVSKVDFLKENGIVQQFISLNPLPAKDNYIKNTDKQGFITIDNINYLTELLSNILNQNLYFFSAMSSLEKIGKNIEIADKEVSFINKAKKFIELMRCAP